MKLTPRCILCWETLHTTYRACVFLGYIGSVWEGVWFPNPLPEFQLGLINTSFYIESSTLVYRPWFYTSSKIRKFELDDY